MVKNAVQYKS